MFIRIGKHCVINLDKVTDVIRKENMDGDIITVNFLDGKKLEWVETKTYCKKALKVYMILLSKD